MTLGTDARGHRLKSGWHNLPRFPVRWILEHPHIENWMVKAIWFAIPIEYYLVTTFSAGFDKSAFGAAAVFSLLYLILLFAVSCGLALLGNRNEYDNRVRVWSIALIITWGTSVALVAGTTFLSRLANLGNDVVALAICNATGSCVPEYPSWSLKTFAIYFVYSAIVLAVLWIGSFVTLKSIPRPRRPGDWSEPNIAMVGVINAAIMTLMHGWANSG